MSTITSSSLAVANAAGVKNVQLVPAAENVQRKLLIIGTGDPTTEAANTLDSPLLALSAEDIGSKTGFGWMLHRLAVKVFSVFTGEVWYIQQAEPAGAQAAGEIDFATSTGVLAGTLALYIGAISVPITVTAGMDVEGLADAVVAAIAADTSLPVTATKTAVTFEVVITSKSEGPWGNNISIALNIQSGDVTPTGIVSAITAMTAGSGLPDVQDALDSLGTAEGANEAFFTKIIASGYTGAASPVDTTTLDAIANYIGQGNDFNGLWDKLVHKPFTSVFGDVAVQAAGLTAIAAIGDARKQDRGNGIISVPGSKSHPAEIAALWAAENEGVSALNPAVDFNDRPLLGIDPGVKSDRWNNSDANRNLAAKAGISPTIIKSGIVYIQNSITMYHPDNVGQNNNGYRDMVNIAKLQNINHNIPLNFSGEKWQGKTIVSDVTKVGDITAKADARDLNAVRDDFVALALAFESKAWIAEAQTLIDSLASGLAIRSGGDGFDAVIQFILSGNVRIFNVTSEFDISFASIS